ncbi:ABC-F family ATP-binding cassette domain-containing protein, partial [Candidatus Saccharibacteria bacterium]|nr:ABC-F family ATP-binding cassette domain-containing protein [Candidatus Saccharibacteria bacterium]NIW78962.1 ATP-binding cassette domain-containing protein [Calditrichia bacterium]
KRIDVLSGGEKARVSLAKILLSPVNFLIMDEPTNHLDIQSKEALEDALEGYDGTLLLISHDRYFLDKLVNRVIEIKDGSLREYEGNYTDYLQRRASRDGHLGRTEPIYGKSDSDSKMDVTAPSKKRKEQKRIEAEARQKVSKERHRLQNEIAYCENRIQELEQQKVDLEKFMADPKSYQDGEHAASLQKEYSAVKDELTELFERWENSQIEYEALMEKLGQS